MSFLSLPSSATLNFSLEQAVRVLRRWKIAIDVLRIQVPREMERFLSKDITPVLRSQLWEDQKMPKVIALPVSRYPSHNIPDRFLFWWVGIYIDTKTADVVPPDAPIVPISVSDFGKEEGYGFIYWHSLPDFDKSSEFGWYKCWATAHEMTVLREVEKMMQWKYAIQAKAHFHRICRDILKRALPNMLPEQWAWINALQSHPWEEDDSNHIGWLNRAWES